MNAKEIIKRYLFSTLGMLLVAVGIALSAVANLGISSLNVASYAMAEGIEGITLGMGNFIIYTILVLLQIVVLGKDFKLVDLLQFVANALLSLMIDGSLWVLQACGIVPGNLVMQFVFIVLACLITAVGISMEVTAQAWMLPAEMTVSAFTRKFGGKFGTNKVIMDCAMILLGAVLCFFLFEGRILGPQDTPIIGWGTVIMAVAVGLMMKLSSPLTDKLWNRIAR